ncbi:MAG TPA: cytochrome P450 [Streptosporangiaceae bacterium]|nr:cytochrome P450 [Streptosporangiaceae bacterium]
MLLPDFKEDPAQDPYPHYARLREAGPVVQINSASGLRPYLITRYEDAKAALSDPRFAKNPHHGADLINETGLGEYFLAQEKPSHMLDADPPDHTRLRKAFANYFTGRQMNALAPRLQQITQELIDGFAPRGTSGTIDFIEAFAGPLPAMVIAEMLGIPDEDRPLFRRISQDIMRPPDDPAQQDAAAKLIAYVTELIGRKRQDPDAALISTLLSQQRDGDCLNEAELTAGVGLLIIAGHETTVNLLGNGMLALLRSPDQMALLRERPSLIPAAIEEFLRYDGPLERAPFRFTTEDVNLRGTVIPRGSVVWIALGSANRDETVYPMADRLDVAREPHPHLAFGHGIHYCLGAPLARLEMEVTLRAVAERVSGLRLLVDPPPYRPNLVVRGLSELPVRLIG